MKRIQQRSLHYLKILTGLLLIMGTSAIVAADRVTPPELRGPSYGDQSNVERKVYGEGQSDDQRQQLDLLAYEVFQPSVSSLKYEYFRVEASELFKRFGTPKIAKTGYVPHRDPSPDESSQVEAITWAFPGMVIDVTAYPPSASHNPERVMISRVEISEPRYTLQNGLRIGQPASEFIAQLGNPNFKHEKMFIYTVEDWIKTKPSVYKIAAYQIKMLLDDSNNVKKITWDWGWH